MIKSENNPSPNEGTGLDTIPNTMKDSGSRPALDNNKHPTPASPENPTDLNQRSDHEQEQRRLVLRSLLAASEERQRKIQKTRLPVLTPETRIGIRSGEFKHCEGIVVDADFIQSRVLLELDNELGIHWVEFSQLTPAPSVIASDELLEPNAGSGNKPDTP